MKYQYTFLLGLMFFLGFGSKAIAATIDFESMIAGAYYGKANVSTGCGGFFNCYEEDGFVVGTTEETVSPFSHLHRDAGISTAVEYHGDSGGIYLRADDNSAFSLESLDVRDIAGDNGNNFRIIGFSEALNPAINTESAPFTNQVASAVISSNGNHVLNEAFQNIKAFWIYYDGYPNTPSDGTQWNIAIDNIELGAAVTATPVPIPFGAIWFFAVALMSLGHGVRKNSP